MVRRDARSRHRAGAQHTPVNAVEFHKAGDTSSASRYFPRDIVNEPLEAEHGRMAVPKSGPGIGVTLNHAFLDTVTNHREEFVA